MVSIILASHGEFAKGILQSVGMIMGEQKNVAAVTLMPSESPDDIHQKMVDAIASFDDKEQVLFLVDFWGGTPFNQASSLIDGHKDTWAILSGMNLPMVVEAYSSRMTTNNAHEIATHLVEAAKEGVKVLPETLAPKTASAGPARKSKAGAPGRMKFVLARLDSRLLHGQVATGWSKAVNPTRIIVVSDTVCKDEMRKKLIQQAAPGGVTAHVIPIKQMVKLYNDDQHFGNERVLLLFETPQDVLKTIEAGVKITELNVGSMAHSVGKVQPNKVLAFDQNDIDTFKALKEKGVSFDVRKVPADSKDNMDAIIAKAQSELDKH